MTERAIERAGRAVVLALAGAAWLIASASIAQPRRIVSGAPSSGPVALGATPPELHVDRVAGRDPVTLFGLRGRVVVLDFWATWCGGCVAQLPSLEQLSQRHTDDGLAVIGITTDPIAVVRTFLSDHATTHTIAVDDGSTTAAYAVRGLPTLVVLDRAGHVRDVREGYAPGSLRELDALVTALAREH